MAQVPVSPASSGALSLNAPKKELAFRAASEGVLADREAQKAEARAILVRLLVRCCMERRKAAA